MGRFSETTFENGVKQIFDKDNDYTIFYSDSYGYIGYDNETGDEVFRMAPDGQGVQFNLKDGSGIVRLDQKISLEDIHRDMTFTGNDGYEYSLTGGVAKRITEYGGANRFDTNIGNNTLDTNNGTDRFDIISSNGNGIKQIIDKENDYTIYYSDKYGYVGYDSKTGDEVFRMSPDGNGVQFNLKDGSGTVRLNEKISLEDIHRDMTFTGDDGYEYSLTNGAKRITDYSNSNGFDTISSNEYTTVFLDETNYYKIERQKLDDGSIRYYAYDADGNVVFENYEGESSYAMINIDGCMTQLKDKNLTCEEIIDRIKNNSNITLYDDSVLEFSNRKPVNITVYNSDGSISIYEATQSRKLLSTETNDGTSYTYDLIRDSQWGYKNGEISYSKINHIEYDEEAYNAILNSFNSISSSYSGSISNECSNIESSINNFPDSYSGGSVGDIGSAIEGHLDLISSLESMTNYSLLAYQTCDEELKNGLYLLIDSMFGDKDSSAANVFKNTIKNNIEDRNSDGILEYKQDTNFKNLSDDAIISNVVVDEQGNSWYFNSNNKIIGIDGNNSFNFGGEEYGETFSLTYDEKGVVIIKDSNGNDLNIFGDYNTDSEQFGGNQSDLRESYNNEYVYTILSKYFSNSTEEEKVSLLDNAASKGCGYTAMTNYIFKYFEGNEEGFYDTFGFPMYEIKSNGVSSDGSPSISIDYNYEPIITELFCEVNSKSGTRDIQETIQKSGGTGPEEINHMFNYIKENYGIVLEKEDDYKFVADDGYSLYYQDGSLYTDNGGPHAMTIVGKNDNNQAFVSTWGRKMIYEQAQNDFYCNFYNKCWEKNYEKV